MTSDDTGMVDEQQRGERVKTLSEAVEEARGRADPVRDLSAMRAGQIAALIEQRDQLIDDHAQLLLVVAAISVALKDFIEASADDKRYPTLCVRGRAALKSGAKQ